MEHLEAVELLEAYHDGALAAARRSGVEEHLAACATCREELLAWRRLAAAFLPPASAAPSAAFVARVMAALPAQEEEAAVSYAPPAWLWPAFGFAAAGLWLAVAWPAGEPVPGAETLLLAGVPEEARTRWAFEDREAGPDELLGLVLEAP